MEVGNFSSNAPAKKSWWADMSKSEKLQIAKSASAGVSLIGNTFSLASTLSNIDSQIAASEVSAVENRRRHNINLKNIRRSAERTRSTQREQYVSSGVKLEGSALDVTSETFYDMLEAELEQENQLAWQEEQMAVQRSNLQSAKRQAKFNFLAKSGMTLLGAM